MKYRSPGSAWRIAVVGLAALGVTLVVAPSRAGTVTYVTPTGSTINGLPVDAQAVLTTGNNTVSITLTNLEANPTSVAQNLSDLTFTLSSGTVSSLSSSSGQEITVHSNGTFTLGSTVSTGWALTGTGTSTGTVEVLGTPEAPKHTIIGPPGGGGTYSNANNSITGNSHNPLLNQTATFTIAGSGITADTTITGVVFSFNTDAGFTVVGHQAVPEPSSLVLSVVGFGVVGAIACRRRRRPA